VTPEQALQHEAVRDRFKHSMQCLEDTTEYFLSAILQSVDKIPYVLIHVQPTGAALHENKEATAKSTSQDGGMAVNFG